MKLVINNEEIVLEKEHIDEHLETMRQGLVEKYGNVDILIRMGMKAVSRSILDKLEEHTGDLSFRTPKKDDPNIHLVNCLFSLLSNKINDININIVAKNGRISEITANNFSEFPKGSGE